MVIEPCTDGRWVYRMGMKPVIPRTTDKAFTILELLVVLAIFAILLTMYLPTINRGCRTPAKQGQCMSNLRQIGLGLLMYAYDHAEQFPWELSTNSIVSKEILESYPASEYFLVLTNYLSPRVFVCPSDETRNPATNYEGFNNSNLSYFAAVSANMTSTTNAGRLILAGDRHLSVDGQATKPGLCTLNENSVLGWTKELHKSESTIARGSLLFVDGHVQFSPSKTCLQPSRSNQSREPAS